MKLVDDLHNFFNRGFLQGHRISIMTYKSWRTVNRVDEIHVLDNLSIHNLKAEFVHQLCRLFLFIFNN